MPVRAYLGALNDLELVQTLAGHSNFVYAVALTADGKTAISGSGDETLKVWNLETGEMIASFSGESPLLCCAVAPNGLTIVAGEASEYPEQNQEDALIYIHHYLTTHELTANLKSWLVQHHLSEPEFSQQLAAQSENNFMYLSQILPALTQGFYPQPFQLHQLPPGLEAYYHILWQHMQGQGLSEVELDILNILVQQSQPISADAIAQIIDQDEYEVEEALENWFEFLHQQQINGEICYSLYHSSFRNFLKLVLCQLDFEGL